MEATAHHHSNAAPRPAKVTPKSGGSRLYGFFKLAVAVFMLWLIMFHIAPALQRAIPPLKQLGDHIEASGIAANMIYYTEVPSTAAAESAMRDSLNYPPVGPGK